MATITQTGLDVWREPLQQLNVIVQNHQDRTQVDSLSKKIYKWISTSIQALQRTLDIDAFAREIIPQLHAILPESHYYLDGGVDAWGQKEYDDYCAQTGNSLSPIDGKPMQLQDHELANDLIKWMSALPNREVHVLSVVPQTPKERELQSACLALKGSLAMLKAGFTQMREKMQETYDTGVKANAVMAEKLREKEKTDEARVQEISRATQLRLDQLQAINEETRREIQAERNRTCEASRQLAEVAVDVPKMKREIDHLKGTISNQNWEIYHLQERVDDLEDDFCCIM